MNTKAFLEVIQAEGGGGEETKRYLYNVFGRRFNIDPSDSKDATGRIRALISKVVLKAKRQNIWYSFSGVGRGILSLCMHLPLKFRSRILLRTLVELLKELLVLLSPLYRYWVRGVQLAYVMSEAAYRWGNKEALKWRYDVAYAISLGLNQMGNPWFRSLP